MYSQSAAMLDKEISKQVITNLSKKAMFCLTCNVIHFCLLITEENETYLSAPVK